jgi:hypothetical protein
MRCRVSSDIGRVPLMAYETVLTETLARLATSAIVGNGSISSSQKAGSKVSNRLVETLSRSVSTKIAYDPNKVNYFLDILLKMLLPYLARLGVTAVSCLPTS